MLPMWIIAIICSIVLCECSGNNTPTPRRKAYPRIETHDSTFTEIVNCPIFFEMSAISSITLDSVNNESENSSRWINIYYKSYNATIYCTFTPVNSLTLKDVIANRYERMVLNSGDHPSELIELTNANDFRSQILTTEQSRVTPIQFLSTNNRNWVISGALYIDNNSNIDSIKPIINIVKRDIIHSLKTVGLK